MKIIESNKEIEKLILKSWLDKINKKLLGKLSAIESNIVNISLAHFKSSDTYNELLYGDLRYSLGFPNGEQHEMVDTVVETAAKSLKVELDQFKIVNDINGGLTVYLLKSGMIDLLSLSQSNIKIEEGNIPWLDWLLTQGDKIIISDYKIIYRDAGRSGGAVMTKSPGSYWKIPTDFAGTDDDNWFTRIVSSQSYLNELQKVIEKFI